MSASIASVTGLSRRVVIGAGLGIVAAGVLASACEDGGHTSGTAGPVSTGPANTSPAGTSPAGATSQLRAAPVAPFARSQHASALLAGGLVLVIGGMGTDGALASCQIYDPSGDAWFDAAPLARARGLLSATPIENGHVLCLGGFDGNNAFGVGSVFDPDTDSWKAVKPLTTPRYHHAAQVLDDGRVIVTGGFNVGPLSVPEIYEL